MSESCPPRAAGNTSGLPSSRGSACNSATARADRGTRCSLPIFMRTPGIIQSALSRSNSSQRAPRTSCERVAVRAANSSARAPNPSRVCKAANQRGGSSRVRAGWLLSSATLDGGGRSSFRLPAQRAGLSPVRCPATVAQLRTASMRPRNRLAVSVRSAQSDCSTRKTSCVVISCTNILPISGVA